MKSKSWYQKEFGLMWKFHYTMDQVAEREKKQATKKAQANNKEIAKRAKEEERRNKRMER